MRIEKKLTIKKIVGDPQKVVRQFINDPRDPEADDGKRVALCRIIGAANRYETGETDIGAFVKFHGQFRGINAQTGEEFRAGQVILPEQAEAIVQGAIDQNDGATVEFAFDFDAVLKADAIRGYEYAVQPVLEPQGDDPLARLSSSLPALPGPAAAAPKSEPEPEPEPAAASGGKGDKSAAK